MKNALILLALPALFLTACTKNDDSAKKNLVVPTSYVSIDYDTNTFEDRMLATRFANLLATIKPGENQANTLDLNVLLAAWNEGGALSLKTKCGPIASGIENMLFPELVKHSGKTYHPNHGDTATLGGVFEGRLLNQGAFEIVQSVDKGSYAGMFLYRILELKKGNFDHKVLDQMLALYGAHPSFPNTPTVANTPKPDKYIANYAARRDKNDGSGYYSKIKTEFLTLHAAIKAGNEYTDEKEQAFARLIQNMEKALAATSINYLNSAISKLSKTNPTDTDKAGALHDLSEALGFIQGFDQLNSPYITISNGDITAIEEHLHINGQGYRYYEFTNDPITHITDIVAAITKLQTIYQFTPGEMIDFKTNWVSAQGR